MITHKYFIACIKIAGVDYYKLMRETFFCGFYLWQKQFKEMYSTIEEVRAEIEKLENN